MSALPRVVEMPQHEHVERKVTDRLSPGYCDVCGSWLRVVPDNSTVDGRQDEEISALRARIDELLCESRTVDSLARDARDHADRLQKEAHAQAARIKELTDGLNRIFSHEPAELARKIAALEVTLGEMGIHVSNVLAGDRNIRYDDIMEQIRQVKNHADRLEKASNAHSLVIDKISKEVFE